MHANNPYEKDYSESKNEYRRIWKNAPRTALVEGIISMGSGGAAVEAASHGKPMLATISSVLGLVSLLSTFETTRLNVIDSHCCGYEAAEALASGNQLEKELIKELNPDNSIAGWRELNEIWDADPSYIGGQNHRSK